jgi:MFS family permease
MAGARPHRPLRLPRALSPLRQRGFRLLFIGQVTSNVGDACYAVALPWYVLATHGGAVLLGTVLAAYGIPRTALIVFGGYASDRWRPQTVMLLSDVTRALVIGALALAATLGPARAGVLVPLAIVIGAGEGLFLPASFSIVPSLLAGDDLAPGNALSSSGTQLATLIGPAVGGALVAIAGPSFAFALDAATFAVSALTLYAMRAPHAARITPATPGEPGEPAFRATPTDHATPDDHASPTDHATPADYATPANHASPTDHGTSADYATSADATAGATSFATSVGPATEDLSAPAPTLRTLFRTERILYIILLVNIAANLGSGGLDGVALPALAHGPLNAGATGYGVILAAFGGGALLGTIGVGQVGRLRRPIVVGSLAYLAEAVCIGLAPYLGSVAGVSAAMVGLGIANGFANVLTITAFQRWAPPGTLGRLTGLLILTSFGIFPLSVAIAAIFVRDLGPAPFFLFAAATLAAAILAGLTQRAWRDFGAPEESVPQPEREKASNSHS